MNTTKRTVLLGGFALAMLAAGIPTVSALAEPAPAISTTGGSTTEVGGAEVGTAHVRSAWMVRPRPTLHRSSTI